MKENVALFVTCLVNTVRPGIGMNTARLLQDAGYNVVVPEVQTCCGQPNYNGGDRNAAVALAKQTIDSFLDYNYVVVPSGSCAGMLIKHYPELLEGEVKYHRKALDFADHVYELSRFLVEVADYKPKRQQERTVTYHDACAGLRELGIKQQPRQLLGDAGIEVTEMQDAEVCCGFGGTFCVKYPDISNAMVSRKAALAQETQAVALVTGDLGCLMNIEGKLQRLAKTPDNKTLPVYHFAELLAEGLE